MELDRLAPVTGLPPAIEGAFVFIIGLVVGSFLNVCIYRMPRERSVIRPPSSCPACARPIPWHDNIPVLSWILLRGRCRFCRAPISLLYPAVELLTAAAFLAAWWRHPDPRVYPVICLVMAGLIATTFIDLYHYIIPDEITLGGVAAGLISAALVPEITGRSTHLAGLLRSLLGVAVGGGGLYLIAVAGSALFKKEAMGMGDVKLMGAVGAFFGPQAPLFSLLVGSVLGSIVGLALMALGRARRDSAIPFGPYLAAGAALYALWGPALIRAYLALTVPPLHGG